MALNGYLQQTQLLLNDETGQFYNPADLTGYINIGRADLAKKTECLIDTVRYSAAAQTFALSALTDATAGYGAAMNVRTVSTPLSGTGRTKMEGRPWQWFQQFYLNGPTITPAKPTVWAQQSQGEAGVVYLSPTPDTTYSLYVEATWIPIPLVDDSTAEAIPYPWTDAIPYFAAYRALLNAQRGQDAQSMWQQYNEFIMGARLGVTPQTQPLNFPGQKTLPQPLDPILTMAPQTGKPAQRTEGNT